MNQVHTLINRNNLDVSEINNVPNSFSSQVYNLLLKSGERVILKIPFNETKLHRERLVLERLQGHLPVPKVLDFWEGDNTLKGALLLSLIEGEPVGGDIDKKISL